MKSKLLLLSASILLITNISFAQTDQLSQKILNEVCPCLESAVKNKSTEEAQKIFERCSKASFEKYDKEIDAAATQLDEEKSAVFMKISFALMKYCPASKTLYENNDSRKKLLKNNRKFPFDSASFKMANSKALLSGKFVISKAIISGNEIPLSDKSAYSIAKNAIWTTYAENNKYKTEFTFREESAGEYEFTLKSNNNPNFRLIKEISDYPMEVGDSYTLTLIGVDKKNPNLYYTELYYMGVKKFFILTKSSL